MRMFSTAVFGNSEDSNRGGVRSSGPHHLHSLREGQLDSLASSSLSSASGIWRMRTSRFTGATPLD
jgi:hypothetical protein